MIQEEPQFSRTEFDFKLLLLKHLENISKLVTYNVFLTSGGNPETLHFVLEKSDEMISKNVVLSIDMLEGLLSPYIDDQFEMELEKWNKEFASRKNNASWLEIRRTQMEKFALLIRLMDRRDLLLEKEDREKI